VSQGNLQVGWEYITDLDRVAACCPNLQHADFSYTLDWTAADCSLSQLTALTSLTLAGPACDAARAQLLLQLTGLCRLQWDYGTASIAELQCLTALTNLQELQLGGWQLQGDWQQQGPNRVLAVCPGLDKTDFDWFLPQLAWFGSVVWDGSVTLGAQVRSHGTHCLHCLCLHAKLTSLPDPMPAASPAACSPPTHRLCLSMWHPASIYRPVSDLWSGPWQLRCCG
jgi:hypothetical protein